MMLYVTDSNSEYGPTDLSITEDINVNFTENNLFIDMASMNIVTLMLQVQTRCT
uniref:Uncharacterized protein n=1 Tax=Arion vulgaris TaxID=1028688 RepID=A0A0B6Y6U1_9EUPU